jgi:hypothetical protein
MTIPPNCWSFRDSVPPEIRIRTYEVAFDVEKDVLIKHYSANKKDGRPRNAFPHLAAYDTQPCMIPCLSPFRCCRRIYNEGMKALLSCKQIISSNHRGPSTSRDYDYTQFVRSWLDEIGPNVPSLRKIVIDIYENASGGPFNPTRVDVLPLFGVMFAHSRKSLQVEFTKTKPLPPLQAPPAQTGLMSVYSATPTIGWNPRYFQVTHSNQALISITEGDVLDLHKFQDLSRWFSAVFVKSCGEEGKIVLRSLSGTPELEIPFLILDKGRTFCKRDHDLAELPYFPPDMMDIMYDYLTCVPEDIVIDLSTLYISPLSVPNRYVDTVTESSLDAYLWYLQNNFKFIMSFSGNHGTHLSNLSRWLKRQTLEVSGPALVSAQLTESSSAKKANTRPRKRATKKYRRISAKIHEDELWKYDWGWAVDERKKKEAQKTARRNAIQDSRTLLRWMKALTFEFQFNGRRRTTMEDLRINVTNFLQRRPERNHAPQLSSARSAALARAAELRTTRTRSHSAMSS